MCCNELRNSVVIDTPLFKTLTKLEAELILSNTAVKHGLRSEQVRVPLYNWSISEQVPIISSSSDGIEVNSQTSKLLSRIHSIISIANPFVESRQYAFNSNTNVVSVWYTLLALNIDSIITDNSNIVFDIQQFVVRLIETNTAPFYNGKVRIGVSFDMAYSKRETGKNYNSLNGYGCIIGFLSEKILDYGSRNHKCKKCDLGHPI